MQALQERVVVNENGRRKTITKLEAVTKQLVNKAAAGEHRSIKHLSELLRQWDKPSESGNPITIVVGERDIRL